MKDILTIDGLPTLQDLRPSRSFVLKTGLMLGMYALLTLVTYMAARAVLADGGLPSCAQGEAMIEYPVYNARGIAVDSEYVCGTARKSCTVKMHTAQGPLYECPGLMRPR